LIPKDKTQSKIKELCYTYEMEFEDFIRNIGLLDQYIEIFEQRVFGENPKLKALNGLFSLSRGIVKVSKIGN
jgi:hypothetical protein